MKNEEDYFELDPADGASPEEVALIMAEIQAWPKVSVELHNCITAVAESTSLLSALDPRVEDFVESLMEIVMNLYPSCDNDLTWHVNPHPVVDFTMVDELRDMVDVAATINGIDRRLNTKSKRVQ